MDDKLKLENEIEELIDNSTTDNRIGMLMKEYNNLKSGFEKLE